MVLLPSVGSRVLAGLSGAAIVAGAGILIATPLLLKAPQSPHDELRSTGPASYLDIATGKPITGTFEQETTTEGHPGVRSASVASYEQIAVTTFVSSTGKTNRLATTSLTFAFDRSTGAGLPGRYGDTVGTTAHFVKLPFDTRHQTYDFWDVTAKRSVPLRYVGEQTRSGLHVLVFSRDVAATDLGVLAVLPAIPGSFLGHPEVRSVPVHEWYEVTQTRLEVEPVTGRLVGGSSSPHLWLQASSGPLAGQRVDLLSVSSATPDSASAARLLATAKHVHGQVLMLRRAPWVLGGLAVVLLVLALLPRARRRTTSTGTSGIPAPRHEVEDIPGHLGASQGSARQRPGNAPDVPEKSLQKIPSLSSATAKTPASRRK